MAATRPGLQIASERPANDDGIAHPDGRVVRALVAFHARPADRWTVATLARVAGLSRAAFARRFFAEVGAPPLRHLTALRIARAAALLAKGQTSLAAIAQEVGYANEFALRRAFRRTMGEPPGVYRRRARGGPNDTALRCMAA